MVLSDDITTKDFISKLLSIHSENRPTIGEVKKHAFFEGISWTKVRNHGYHPFYIPKLDNNFDTSHFCTQSGKNKACYISNASIGSNESVDQLDLKQAPFNQQISQDMRNEI